MSVRAIKTSFGIIHYAICDECKRESDKPLTEGVAHAEDALNVAYPFGWTHERAQVTGKKWPRVRFDFCPACSVAPEYRRQS